MILCEEGIGKLKNISYSEFEMIINSLPKEWGYSFKYKHKSQVDEKYNKYNVKLFRKKTI